MNKPRRQQAPILGLLLALAGGCASRGAGPRSAPPGGEVVRYEMDPINIEARRGPTGVEIEAYDAQGLFDLASKSLEAAQHDEAVRLYSKLLEKFPDSIYTRPALYNRGLAERDKRNYAVAIASFQIVVDRWPEHDDAKDALFQMGACHAELMQWSESLAVFTRILARADLNADDKIEGLARRGLAEMNLGHLDLAEDTFNRVFAFHSQIQNEERLVTDFFLAFARYQLAQIAHQRFRQAPIRLPESQMAVDLESKATLLLQAQRRYIETMRIGDPRWASAAGFQVGLIYEELYDAFMNAPVPPEHTGESRDIYMEQLRVKIRVLLEKSLRWQRENLLMIERLGLQTDWADKSKVAYAKLLKLLDPKLAENLPDELRPSAASGAPPAAPPPVPTAPNRDQDGGGPAGAVDRDGKDGSGPDGRARDAEGKDGAPAGPRQIL